jgi:hypothetical protein
MVNSAATHVVLILDNYPPTSVIACQRIVLNVKILSFREQPARSIVSNRNHRSPYCILMHSRWSIGMRNSFCCCCCLICAQLTQVAAVIPIGKIVCFRKKSEVLASVGISTRIRLKDIVVGVVGNSHPLRPLYRKLGQGAK